MAAPITIAQIRHLLPTVTAEGGYPGIATHVENFNAEVRRVTQEWETLTEDEQMDAVDTIKISLITQFGDTIIPALSQAENVVQLEVALAQLPTETHRVLYLVGGLLSALTRSGVAFSQAGGATPTMTRILSAASSFFSSARNRMSGLLGKVTGFATRILTALITPRTPTSYPSVQVAIDAAIAESGLDAADLKFDVLRNLLRNKIRYVPSPDIDRLRSTGRYGREIDAYVLSGQNEVLARVLFAIAINLQGRLGASSSPAQQTLIQTLVVETFVELLMTALEHDINRYYFQDAFMAEFRNVPAGSQTETNVGGDVSRPVGYTDIEALVPIVTTCIAGIIPAAAGPLVDPIRALITATGIPETIAADFAYLRSPTTPEKIARLRAIQQAYLVYVNAPRPGAVAVNVSLNATRQAARTAQAALALAGPVEGTGSAPNYRGISSVASTPPPTGRNFSGVFARLTGDLPPCVPTAADPHCSATVSALMDARIEAHRMLPAAGAASAASSDELPVTEADAARLLVEIAGSSPSVTGKRKREAGNYGRNVRPRLNSEGNMGGGARRRHRSRRNRRRMSRRRRVTRRRA